MEPLLFAIPWLAFVAFVSLGIRLPRPIRGMDSGEPKRGGDPGGRDSVPHRGVSVVVPARNELANIEGCLESLAASEYPDFEIVVVDDRSDDGTGRLARAVFPNNARSIRVVEGRPLPEGWLGKPWACHQGAEIANGEILLFTDADTIHRSDLLARAVASMDEDDSAALTLMGRQLLGSFWEYLLQPQMFGLLALRFRRLDHTFGPENWRDCIANGQFILVEKGPYEAIGGHGAVRAEVVEDMRFAQVLCRAGHRLSLREAEDQFATRMYRSRKEIIEGWAKNVYVGSRQSLGSLHPLLAAMAPAAMIAMLLGLWVAPAVGLLLGLVGVFPRSVVSWGATTYGLSTLFWIMAHRRFKAPVLFAPLHPLGALGAAWIVLKSWRGGGQVRWKGRDYQVSIS